MAHRLVDVANDNADLTHRPEQPAHGFLLQRRGLFGDYRRTFWRFARPLLRAGRLDELIAAALVAHHMIRFARDCTEGRQNASFYTDRPKAPAAKEPAEAA
jgi:hypothetical protein